MSPLKRRLLAALSKDLVIDLMDMASARTLSAFELVRDNTDLRGRSARALEGQARFRLMEKGFQDVCERHGAIALEGGVLPKTDLRFFQPFMRFGGQSKKGVILGFASMPTRRELPTENQSRAAGVSLNYYLSPRLFYDDRSPKPGDIFVLLLVSRHPDRAGQVEEVAIGVINSEYSSYLFYEPAEQFLADYAKPVRPASKDKTKLVRLKSERKPFAPPEHLDRGDEKKNNG